MRPKRNRKTKRKRRGGGRNCNKTNKKPILNI